MHSDNLVKARWATLGVLACTAAFAAGPKKVLVFSRCEGFNHKESIAVGNQTIRDQASKMGYTVDFTLEYDALKLENLKKYDTLLLNNTTNMKTKDNPFVEPSLIEYVRSGGGLCLIHAALDNFYDAPACSIMGGGRFDGHPWGASGGEWKFKVEEPDHPVNAAFKALGPSFALSDEIYQHSSPFYDRSQLRVLISLDLTDPVTRDRKGQKRADGDYAVSWVRAFGKGRVFYTTFAHDGRAWRDPVRRAHIFAGLAYCLGDLKAPDTPREISWSKATSAERCSLLSAYAMRGDAKAVAAHLDDANADVAKAAALALGRIGCPKALELLMKKTKEACGDATLADARRTALGAALGRMAECGKAKEAAAVAKTVYECPKAPAWLRAAATRVLVKADASFFPTALADKSKLVCQAAISAACCVPNATLEAELKKTKCPCAKVALLKKLAAKRAKESVKTVAAFVADADEDVSVAALEAIGALGGPADVPAILSARSRGGAVAAKADEVLAEMGGIGDKIFELAKGDIGYLAVAAKRGETKNLKGWEQFIKAADPKTRKAAWRAFGKISTPETLAASLAWLGSVGAEEADVAKTAAWHALRGLPAAERDEKVWKAWRAAGAEGRKALEDLVFRANGIDAFDFWKKHIDAAGSSSVQRAAKKAYVATAAIIEADITKGAKKADSTKWKASASRDGHNVKNAFDGNDNSRWTSGMNPKGVWYALDFGDKLFVDEVTLDTTKSAGDTPRGCEVFVSDDGTNWTGPVAACDENTQKTTSFRIGKATRHLKFVALESRQGLHWSIHEIEVKAGVDEAKVKKIKATAAQYRQEGVR